MLSHLIIMFVIPLVFSIVISTVRKESYNSNIFTYPRYCTYVTGIFGVFITITFAFALLEPNTVFVIMYTVYLLTIFMILGLVFLTFYTANYKLVLDESEMLYRNFLGVVKRYKYEDITKIVCAHHSKNSDLHEFRIHIGRKMILVAPMQYNFVNFERTMKKRLSKLKIKMNFIDD